MYIHARDDERVQKICNSSVVVYVWGGRHFFFGELIFFSFVERRLFFILSIRVQKKSGELRRWVNSGGNEEHSVTTAKLGGGNVVHQRILIRTEKSAPGGFTQNPATARWTPFFSKRLRTRCKMAIKSRVIILPDPSEPCRRSNVNVVIFPGV